MTNQVKLKPTSLKAALKQFNMNQPVQARFYVAWDGYSESDFKVVDGLTDMVVKMFSSVEMGATNARYAAQFEAAQRNVNNYANFGEY